MPTVLRIDGYRFFFFSNEHTPEHIHIEKADKYARVELDSLNVTDSYNMNSSDLKKMIKLVKDNRHLLKERWDEYFKE